ncbi:MAG: hypothetical protein LCH32_09170 [Bacteroidetes bacterium]|nr:hypothetical protein [Bacteroidota bacterium]
MKKIVVTLLLLFSFLCYSQGDCPPTLICANSAGTALAGSVSELNATNQGCLFGEAARTSWVAVCFSTGGIFRFLLNPGGGAGNDMDWLVWGPNPVCPPTTGPVRCSYAAVSGGSNNTGINSVNNAPQTDNSETASGNQWTQDLVVAAGDCYILCISNYGAGNNTWALDFTGTTALMTCSPLNIDLISFIGNNFDAYNQIKWECATEKNNNYFLLQRSNDASSWEQISLVYGAGNSNEVTKYYFNDYNYIKDDFNYYRIVQVDYDGKKEASNIISVDNHNSKIKKVTKMVNLVGKEVDENYDGTIIYYYSDGTHQKVLKSN